MLVPHHPVTRKIRRAAVLVETEDGEGYLMEIGDGMMSLRTLMDTDHEPMNHPLIKLGLSGHGPSVTQVWNFADLFDNIHDRRLRRDAAQLVTDTVQARIKKAHDELTKGVREEPPA